VPEVFGFVKKNLVWRYPERSEGSAPRAEKGVRGKGRQPFSLPSTQRPRRALARRFSAAFFAHRIAPHLQAMRVVNQPVEDTIGGRGIADLLVPARDRQL